MMMAGFGFKFPEIWSAESQIVGKIGKVLILPYSGLVAKWNLLTSFHCNLSTWMLLGGGIRPFPYSPELIGRDSYFPQINGRFLTPVPFTFFSFSNFFFCPPTTDDRLLTPQHTTQQTTTTLMHIQLLPTKHTNTTNIIYIKPILILWLYYIFNSGS